MVHFGKKASSSHVFVLDRHPNTQRHKGNTTFCYYMNFNTRQNPKRSWFPAPSSKHCTLHLQCGCATWILTMMLVQKQFSAMFSHQFQNPVESQFTSTHCKNKHQPPFHPLPHAWFPFPNTFWFPFLFQISWVIKPEPSESA